MQFVKMIQTLSSELGFKSDQISTVIELIEEGGTIPFIARYRKERTGNLDEVEIRDIRDRYDYLTELSARKKTILESIDEQGKLTDELKNKIAAIATKQALEDLYLPYKPKRRTKATIAKEMGLEPLADLIRDQEPFEEWIANFIQETGSELTVEAIRKHARDIIAEWVSEDADLKAAIRDACWSKGEIQTAVRKEFVGQQSKYEIYYEFSEAVRQIPAHRFLAIRRAEEESVIRVKMEFPEEQILEMMQDKWVNRSKQGAEEITTALQDAMTRLLLSSIEVDIRLRLKTEADDDSILIFGKNMRELLLAPLGGAQVILGLDPAFRTGTKWVVVDETGKLTDNGVIYPVEPQNQVDRSRAALLGAISKHGVTCICVGNGTASREVMGFVRKMLKEYKLSQITPVIVNESGASVYSASDVAREEFPDLDLTFRGSVSIARRFQDPLAELVKIDPKAIGVGQYQHDVNQRKLKKSLDEVVESCVNYVGVNLNTASASLLAYVSGLNATLAKNIIEYRNENGSFGSRKELNKVARFGPKAFEQSAGFLRIQGGKNLLDQSAVHPENYKLVEQMATDLNSNVAEMIGNEALMKGLDKSKYVEGEIGLITIQDVLDELKKAGRDPRDNYVGAKLDDDVQSMEDLMPGMQLEGTVTNLTKFGAFVDIGVHQDGLIHVSELSDTYVSDPTEVCAVGQIMQVRVLDVDVDRKRISLSAKQKGGDSFLGASGMKVKEKKKEPVVDVPKATGDMKTDLQILQEKFGNM